MTLTRPDLDQTGLRALDEAAFRERYGCDRFTASVLGNRFGYLVEHMSVRLLNGAFSPVLRDFYDLAATISGPPELGYPVPAASNGIVLMAGTTIDAVRNVVEEFGAERLVPGDVLVANDPYRTGNHNNDLLFTRPVFVDGRIAAFLTINAHQLDMGGVVPGGFSCTKRSVYENGLVIAPQLFVHAGEPVESAWHLLFDNVRMAEVIHPDLRTLLSSLELGERLLLESVDRYGVRSVHGAMRHACDEAAERMADGLRSLPDGDWTGMELVDCDGVDDSEEYEIHVAVRKRGERVEVDLSGTSRQARTSINATALDVKTTVGVALKYFFDPTGRFSSGLYRNVDVIIPEGTIVSALPPDGAVFMYFEQNQAVIGALLRALAGAVGEAAVAGDRGCPDLHTAFGVDEAGRPWVSAMQCGGEIGPLGANRFGDGESQAMTYQANGVAPEIEAIESESPVVVLRHEPVPDTGGAGTHRGGAAMLRDSAWLTEASHTLNELRYKRAPGFGVCGGGTGATGGIWHFPPDGSGVLPDPGVGGEAYRDAVPLAGVIDANSHLPSRDGEYLYPFRTTAHPTAPLAVLRYRTNGGGGWGDPLARNPQAVLVDVRDGYVTVKGAQRDYGVVVLGNPEHDPEGLEIDEAATTALRNGTRTR
ncbi:hydantoinase B/oxoprolinase family protein [Pseudonocardia lutea]|uniref:Hydantoinase B/oxoprolinase family protein n=1 Tax=Pseudonocardia lutea TaxID=2172015 RepID=A0ABW1I0Y3_9PSEU